MIGNPKQFWWVRSPNIRLTERKYYPGYGWYEQYKETPELFKVSIQR
jgi:hypothetical protein